MANVPLFLYKLSKNLIFWCNSEQMSKKWQKTKKSVKSKRTGWSICMRIFTFQFNLFVPGFYPIKRKLQEFVVYFCARRERERNDTHLLLSTVTFLGGEDSFAVHICIAHRPAHSVGHFWSRGDDKHRLEMGEKSRNTLFFPSFWGENYLRRSTQLIVGDSHK